MLLILPSLVMAHVSEQGLVLLLPTGIYISSGVLAVILTLVLLIFLPASWSHRLFKSRALASIPDTNGSVSLVTSALCFVLLVVLLLLGVFGAHDPLENPLPLFIWTLFWIGWITLHGVVGNLWHFTNPWRGPYQIICRLLNWNAPWKLPHKLGSWPGVVSLLIIIGFALAYIAPDAPATLALVVSLYWLFHFIGTLLFNEEWLDRAECLTILTRRYAQLAPIMVTGSKVHAGFPGWLGFLKPAHTVGGAVFILVLLGSGSFDGLNETFLWLSMIGINPLEFPGRSAVVVQTVTGLLLANVILIGIYGACIFFGNYLANRLVEPHKKVSFRQAFTHLAIALLPIAFVYHFAHYLTAFLVNVQYALAAASDPLDTGADFLGLGTFYVTTGFLNSHHTVEAIWLTQAAAVVLGHVLSVLLAHAIALNLFASARRAIISQAPLAVFMVAYTFIGLWLLAAPRGA